MSMFQSVADQILHLRNEQRYKYNYTYIVTGIVAAATTKPIILTVEQDADFLCERMTGSVFGPVDTTSGLPLAANTDFPQPGIAVGAGFAGRGMTMAWQDTGNSRPLSRGQVPVEAVLTPGYDIGFHLPYPYKYYARRNSKIQFDFRNRDTQAAHNIDVVWNGVKYQTPDIPDQQDIQANAA